jgi:hypothetical protein
MEIYMEISGIMRSKGNYFAKIVLVTFFLIVLVVMIMFMITVKEFFTSEKLLNENNKKIK